MVERLEKAAKVVEKGDEQTLRLQNQLDFGEQRRTSKSQA